MKEKPLGLESYKADIRTGCRLVVLDQDDGRQLAAVAIWPQDPKDLDVVLETYETTWNGLLQRISPIEWNGALLRVVLQRHTGDLWYLCVGTAGATAKAISLASVTFYRRAQGEHWNYWDIRMEQTFVDTWLDHVRKRGYLWLVVTDGTEAYFPDLTVRIPASAVLVRDART